MTAIAGPALRRFGPVDYSLTPLRGDSRRDAGLEGRQVGQVAQEQRVPATLALGRELSIPAVCPVILEPLVWLTIRVLTSFAVPEDCM